MGVGQNDTKLDGCPRIIQILVFFFNFIFFIFACVMIGYGAYTLSETKDYSSITDVDYTASANLVIAVGVFVALVAFFGCCGACKLNKCLLMTFIVCLVLILICEIAVVAVGYAFKNKVIDQVDEDMKKNMQNKYGTGDDGMDKAIDALQKELGCCGTTNYTDWNNSTWAEKRQGSNSTGTLPDSCCKKVPCGKSNHYKEGCAMKFEDLIKKFLPVIAGIGIGILIIQLLGIIFSIVLISQMQKGTYA